MPQGQHGSRQNEKKQGESQRRKHGHRVPPSAGPAIVLTRAAGLRTVAHEIAADGRGAGSTVSRTFRAGLASIARKIAAHRGRAGSAIVHTRRAGFAAGQIAADGRAWPAVVRTGRAGLRAGAQKISAEFTGPPPTACTAIAWTNYTGLTAVAGEVTAYRRAGSAIAGARRTGLGAIASQIAANRRPGKRPRGLAGPQGILPSG